MCNDDRVIDTIKKLYRELPKPILLSTLGTMLRKEGCAISGGIKNFIEEKVDGFTVVQNQKISERVAISSLEDVDNTQKMIDNVDENIDVVTKENNILKSMYRSVLYAFCSNINQDSYISINYPFKFTYSPTDSENYKKIKKEDKIDIFLPNNITKISREDSKKLYSKIEEWCIFNDIDMHIFVKKSETKENVKNTYKSILPQILVEFIECQKDEVKKELVIPLSFLIK